MSKPEKLVIQEISLDAIIVDQDLQSRESTDVEHVKYLSDLKQAGAELPPVVLFQDPALKKNKRLYWLADGHHRYAMHRKLGLCSIKADIRQGDKRDAILYSIGANAKQGKQLTSGDRNKAVLMLISDPEWRQWSDVSIARMTGTSVTPVKKIRAAYCQKNGIETHADVKMIRGGKETLRRVHRGVVKGEPTLVEPSHRGVIRAKFPGANGLTHLSKDPVVAAEKFKELSKSWWSERASEGFTSQHLRHVGLVRTWLKARGIMSSPGEGRRSGQPGEPGKRHTLTPDIAGDCFLLRLVATCNNDTLKAAFGDAYLWRLSDPNHPHPRAVILCFPTKECQEVIDLICQTGVEVMTPEEFVASFETNQHRESMAS
jgi:hypothetical protein